MEMDLELNWFDKLSFLLLCLLPGKKANRLVGSSGHCTQPHSRPVTQAQHEWRPL